MYFSISKTEDFKEAVDFYVIGFYKKIEYNIHYDEKKGQLASAAEAILYFDTKDAFEHLSELYEFVVEETFYLNCANILFTCSNLYIFSNKTHAFCNVVREKITG